MRQRRFVGAQAVFDAGDFSHRRFGFGVLALAFEGADLLGGAVALRLQLFGGGLQLFALRFHVFKSGAVQSKAALRQLGGNGGGIGAEQLDVEHIGSRM